MKAMKSDKIRQAVRKTYGKIATGDAPGCGGVGSTCCSGGACGSDKATTQARNASERMGYSAEELDNAPKGANLGLGCGNPQAIASLKSGETVIDLGSGGGFDCFLAARAVGDSGRVIGVDMTAEMISKARENSERTGANNVEFRLGEIEHLPVADNSADVIISNCVINLSPDKPAVYQEAFRVLRPGGRLAISDVVATAELPGEVKQDLALHAGCIAGASLIPELESLLEDAGFTDIKVTPVDKSKELIREWAPGCNVADFIVSANIEARKPGNRHGKI